MFLILTIFSLLSWKTTSLVSSNKKLQYAWKKRMLLHAILYFSFSFLIINPESGELPIVIAIFLSLLIMQFGVTSHLESSIFLEILELAAANKLHISASFPALENDYGLHGVNSRIHDLNKNKLIVSRNGAWETTSLGQKKIRIKSMLESFWVLAV